MNYFPIKRVTVHNVLVHLMFYIYKHRQHYEIDCKVVVLALLKVT